MSPRLGLRRVDRLENRKSVDRVTTDILAGNIATEREGHRVGIIGARRCPEATGYSCGC